jgi:hypothetical protein
MEAPYESGCAAGQENLNALLMPEAKRQREWQNINLACIGHGLSVRAWDQTRHTVACMHAETVISITQPTKE